MHIEYLSREKGWTNSYRDISTWPDCEWFNEIIGREFYHLVEDDE